MRESCGAGPVRHSLQAAQSRPRAGRAIICRREVEESPLMLKILSRHMMRLTVGPAGSRRGTEYSRPVAP